MFFSFLFDSQEVKKRKRSEKLRRRFPWLWAIRQSWSPNYGSVLQQKADIVNLMSSHQDGERELWVVVREDDYERIIKTVQVPGSSLAQAVMKILPQKARCTRIEYLAVVEGENRRIVVFCGTEQCALDQMCRQYSR